MIPKEHNFKRFLISVALCAACFCTGCGERAATPSAMASATPAPSPGAVSTPSAPTSAPLPTPNPTLAYPLFNGEYMGALNARGEVVYPFIYSRIQQIGDSGYYLLGLHAGEHILQAIGDSAGQLLCDFIYTGVWVGEGEEILVLPHEDDLFHLTFFDAQDGAFFADSSYFPYTVERYSLCTTGGTLAIIERETETLHLYEIAALKRGESAPLRSVKACTYVSVLEEGVFEIYGEMDDTFYSLCGLIDAGGNMLHPKDMYSNFFRGDDGYCAYDREAQKSFFLDDAFQILPLGPYDDARPFFSGYAWVMRDGHPDIIGMDGESVLSRVYEHIDMTERPGAYLAGILSPDSGEYTYTLILDGQEIPLEGSGAAGTMYESYSVMENCIIVQETPQEYTRSAPQAICGIMDLTATQWRIPPSAGYEMIYPYGYGGSVIYHAYRRPYPNSQFYLVDIYTDDFRLVGEGFSDSVFVAGNTITGRKGFRYVLTDFNGKILYETSAFSSFEGD